jgi:hypothetical protein
MPIKKEPTCQTQKNWRLGARRENVLFRMKTPSTRLAINAAYYFQLVTSAICISKRKAIMLKKG